MKLILLHLFLFCNLSAFAFAFQGGKLENEKVNWHDIPVVDLGLKRALEGVHLIGDPSEYAVVWAQAKTKGPLEYKAKVLMKKTRTTCEVQLATKSVGPTQYKLVTKTCAPLFGKPQLGSDSPVLYKRDCEYVGDGAICN